MLRNLLSLRVNMAIVFLGAFAVIFLIKLTSLLPGQFYFSFSKLVSGDRGPFIVDPPSVTGQKVCDLLRRNRISTEELASMSVNCALVREDKRADAALTASGQFSPAAIDQIYAVALANDADIRKGVKQFADGLRLTPMSEAEFETLLDENRTPDAVYRKLLIHYERAIDNGLGDPLRKHIDTIMQPVPEPSSGEQAEASTLDLPPLSPQERQSLKLAHARLLTELANGIAIGQPAGLGKTALDNILATAYGKWGLTSGMVDAYVAPLKDTLAGKLNQSLNQNGIALRSKEEARRIVFSEVSEAGLKDYIVSVLIRLAPVLLFGAVLGYLFGRREFLSISLAAALAAFLLSWPLMLLWETLVGGDWVDQKPLFMVFYLVYALSFYVTARFGAVIGALLRRAFVAGGRPLIETRDGGVAAEAVTLRDFAVNLVTGAAVNGAVYAWNVIIPLSAGS